MKSIRAALKRFLRGPAASRLLARFGIDPKRFWLLIDLFSELSEQGEITDQLGENRPALQLAFWIYFVFSAALSVILLFTNAEPAGYSTASLAMTALLLLTVLLSEAGNSLVNPVEALALAHQPINGATYAAAKLTHLLRIVFYLVPALNIAPAVGGSFLKNAPGWFGVAHMAAALAVGLLTASLCCSAYGWLIRFVPAKRLKTSSQALTALPFLALMFWTKAQRLFSRTHVPGWLGDPVVYWPLGIAAVLGASAVVILGIRSLSADYLIRVSGMMRGGPTPRALAGRPRRGDIVARCLGGPAARAGFDYVGRMMRRDYQFRRQLVAVLPSIIFSFGMLAAGVKTDPFSGRFSSMHVVPHLCGLVLLSICSALAYGNDYKAVWVFQLAPGGAFRGFARGAYALLWLYVALLPNLAFFAVLAWFWGPWHAAVFAAFSVAAVSFYLALELRLVKGVPFGNQFDSRSGAAMLPMVLAGFVLSGLLVGLQHFLLFRSPSLALGATAALAAAAWLLTGPALSGFEAAMRYNLSVLGVESGRLYTEVT